ncbi:MAG: sialate O-acetylesterase [bacterium]
MKKKILISIICMLTLFCGASIANAANVKIKMASPFQTNMVLQQKMKLPVWGTANPTETVTVEFAGQKKTAIADANGDWKLVLDPLPASNIPGKMQISGTVDTAVQTIDNILVGEVWLTSGQSNMELTVKDCNNSKEEIAQATDSNIRVFTTGHSGVPKPQKFCNGSWAVNSPENVGKLTAAGYFFARELRAKLKVPVGIINSSWGGSPIQPWTPWEEAVAVKAMKERVDSFANANTLWLADKVKYQEIGKQNKAKFDEERQKWMKNFIDNDMGMTEKWYDPAIDTKKWQPINMPMPDVANSFNNMGSLWFRLDNVKIPDAWVGKKLTLNLGAIDDGDITWVNGVEIGRTLYENPNGWRTPRHYVLPADLIKTNSISITIHAVNMVFSLGVYGKPADMSLTLADDASTQPVSLTTTWQGRVGSETDMTKQPVYYNTAFPEQPQGDLGNFYNGMIAPIAGYGIKGTLWYQGESNANEPDVYAELFPAMIKGWRRVWGQGDFSFYFVQLAGFCARQSFPIEKSSWAEVKEAQMKALALPHTGMAISADIGDAADIHPRDKQDVGKRLALIALANDYGQKIEFSGPAYKSMKVRGSKIQIKFDHSKGLTTVGKAVPTGFAIAGADKIFYWTQAKISGSTVTVWSDKVSKPVAIRYNWAFNPIGNLVNKDNLPASQFRTDNWLRGEIGCGERI